MTDTTRTLERAAALTREILRLGFAGMDAVDSPAVRGVRELLASASSQELRSCLVHLEEHRLLGLAYWVLARHDLFDGLPVGARDVLRSPYERMRALGTMQQLTLQGVAARFKALGIQPVACKGVVLQGEYYPDPGMRFMQDLDLWIPGDFRLACESVLLQLGFRPMPRHLPDGGNYRNAAGVIIDLHWRMRLFESAPGGFEGLTREAPGGAYRVFEPHALITHLCAHMLGHYPETGPMICWLIDLGFVLRKVGPQIDAGRLQRLMPSPRHWLTFLRSVGFLEHGLGFESPRQLAHHVRQVEPLSFSSALRLRRLALWGLPSFLGWGRLLASLARLRASEGVPRPTLRDLSLWPVDWAEHWWHGHRIRRGTR